MTQIQHNQLVSFIWNIANDVLVNVYNKGDYRKVILPMIVLRRFDAVLEDTKKEVFRGYEKRGFSDERTLNRSQYHSTRRSIVCCCWTSILQQFSIYAQRFEIKDQFPTIKIT